MRPFEYSLVTVEDREKMREQEEELWEDGGTTTILEFPVRKHHVQHGKVKDLLVST